MSRKLKVAIVQWSAVHLDIKASVEKALTGIDEAADQGAQLIVFGETWFSGYPSWLDYSPEVAFWDHPPVKKAFSKMLDNCLTKNGEEIKVLQAKARERQVSLVFGANERDDEKAKGTIYNALFFINESGEIVNHHRKLVPTYSEKMLYGGGDGYGLVNSTLSDAKVTGLVCWEHWMPLSRQALHDTGEEIHIAVWPKVHEMHQVASRQYAFEGRCFVLAAGQMFQAKDFPEGIKLPEELDPNTWVLNGGSCIVAPNGKYIVEPQWDEEKIIYAELDLDQVKEESMTLDVTGHYQRDDVFSLEVNRARKSNS